MAGLHWRGEAPFVGSIPTISRNNYLGGEMTERFNLFEGNCLEVMATMPDNSIDSIVTDPPYELGFMGKSWDSSGIAFNVEVWQEALRVLKPGGHLLAFSGSRTYHRMAVAIEDAGFEIRDQIMWIYGSGFPKSHNVSKGIDKAAGELQHENVGFTVAGSSHNDKLLTTAPAKDYVPPKPATPAAKLWYGWGTALKPAHEPIVVARKPLIGTVANNVLTYGTGGLNIDGARVGSEGGGTNCTKRDDEGNCIGHDNAGRSTSGATIHAAESNGGRWPANVIHDGSDEVVELFPEVKGKVGMKILSDFTFSVGDKVEGAKFASQAGLGDSGSAARFFYCAKASKKDRNEGLDGLPKVRRSGLQGADNDNENLDPVSERFRTEPSANHHPTVKPTSLMQYLVRLVTPPNGIVLDPFLGSGSTGKAAMYEGFNFIGIELTPEYLPIAKARIEFALASKELELDFDTP